MKNRLRQHMAAACASMLNDAEFLQAIFAGEITIEPRPLAGVSLNGSPLEICILRVKPKGIPVDTLIIWRDVVPSRN